MGSRPTKFPAIPDDRDHAVPALKEAVEVGLRRRGDPLDGFVKFRDLQDAGLIAVGFEGRGVSMRPGPGLGGPGGGDTPPGTAPDFGEDDMTRPPAPEGVRARGINLNTIGVTWMPPGYNNHAYAEIFASFTDDWGAIKGTFNHAKPIGPGNQTSYFMGTASGTTWLHRNLGSTVPTADLERPILSISSTQQSRYLVYVDGDQTDFYNSGETVYFSADTSWNGNGIQGEVNGATYDSLQNTTRVDIAASGELDENAPTGATLVVIRDTDDLEEALNPRTIYYWVRFVSTAGVSGPVQEGGGVPGTVMVNPEEVLNILTGRIRASQLASDLATPINFIRGPINELDESGQRKYPTVRDFVLDQSGELISDYDEDLESVVLAHIGSIESAQFQHFRGYVSSAHFFFPEKPDLSKGDSVTIFASDGSHLDGIDGTEAYVRDVHYFDSEYGWRVWVTADYSWPEPHHETIPVQGSMVKEGGATSSHPGIAAAATFLRNVSGQVGSDGAWIQSLETLQAALQNDSGELQNLDGIHQIIGTIQEKSLVKLGLEGSALAVWNNLQLDLEDSEGNTQTYVANEVAQQVLVNDGKISNSITFKAQQNDGGVLYSAGFGIGLESEPGTRPESTFAVAADNFAIMAAAGQGRVITKIQASGDKYVVHAKHTANTGASDGLEVDELVTLSVPFGSSVDQFRGKVFKVIYRGDLPTPGETATFPITIEHVPQKDGDEAPDLLYTQTLEDEAHAIFPQQSVPFVVDTTQDPPVIGVRGKLIVDGMVTATEAEITDLLRANEIWAGGITAFGLVNTSSLIGERIATPRYGGWAMRMSAPSSPNSKVLELSKWGSIDDGVPDSDNPEDWLEQERSYPQLGDENPLDTSFWLDAQGNSYMRGSLQVSGNARIMTYAGALDSYDQYFVQMDNEFPLSVFPWSEVNEDWQDTPLSSPWIYGDPFINPTLYRERTAKVKGSALFWVNRDGTAGFNTGADEYSDGFIYLNDSPLDPPNGDGRVRVIRRLEDGQPVGTGQVWGYTQFAMANDQHQEGVGLEGVIGCTYALFLASANKDYGGLSTTKAPSEFNGTGNVYLGTSATKMDAHWLLIRATSASDGTGSADDGGYLAFKDWRAQHPELIKISEYFGENRNDKVIAGAARNVPASSNYKLLVVVVERFDRHGNPIDWSFPYNSLPYAGHTFVQQLGSSSYSGNMRVNTASGGARALQSVPDSTEDDSTGNESFSLPDDYDWSVKVGGGSKETINAGDVLEIVASGAASVSRSGKTITVSATDTNTDTNNYVNSVGFSGGTLTLGRQGLSDLSVSLDGRYLQSESDPTVPSHVKGITSGQISNWDAAYGWGDHSAAGYLTSESDPTVPSHVKNITSGQISNWDTAYGWGDWSTGVDKSFVDALGVDAATISDWQSSELVGLIDSTTSQLNVTEGQFFKSGYGGVTIHYQISLNQGAGSGLDADKVDGFHASSLVKTANNSTLNSDNRNTRGPTRLFRHDSNSDYSVQVNWTGSYWRLRGYNGDSFHSECRVGYSDDAGDADTVDGLHASAFIRANANDNVFGHTEWQDGYQARFGNSADLRIWHNGGNNYIYSYGHGAPIIFRTEDGSGNHSYFHMRPDGDFEIDGSATGVDWEATSDRRLKEAIEPLNNSECLDIINRLRPSSFRWKESGVMDTGLIAQEVEEVLPERVSRRGDDETRSLSYGKLVTHLIGAFQALEQRVRKLEG